MHHRINISIPFFTAIVDGRKNFEIRRDDRGFQAGDTITLSEYDYRPDKLGHTGRAVTATIGYVSSFEQQPGYVVFSLLNTREVSNEQKGIKLR